jgi:hypothetical protein
MQPRRDLAEEEVQQWYHRTSLVKIRGNNKEWDELLKCCLDKQMEKGSRWQKVIKSAHYQNRTDDLVITSDTLYH